MLLLLVYVVSISQVMDTLLAAATNIEQLLGHQRSPSTEPETLLSCLLKLGLQGLLPSSQHLCLSEPANI